MTTLDDQYLEFALDIPDPGQNVMASVHLATPNATLCTENGLDLMMSTPTPGCSQVTMSTLSRCQLETVSEINHLCSFKCKEQQLSNKFFIFIKEWNGLQNIHLCDLFVYYVFT